MEKHNKNTPVDSLDDEVVELLAEAQQSVDISSEVKQRMKTNLMDRISQTKQQVQIEDFITVFNNSVDGWIEALPGAYVKVLQGDISQPKTLMSYLVRLEAGFNMQGHDHPFDEETLMLEGDLSLGDIKLSAGDYHAVKAGTSHGDVSTKKGCIAFMRGALPV